MPGLRSLGTLTLDLVAKIGGFVQGMDKAARAADTRTRKIEQRVDHMSESLKRSFGGIAKTLAAVFAVREVVQFTKSLAEVQIAAQKIHFTMAQAFGQQAGAQIEFVTKLSQKLGLTLQTSEQAFAELGASAQGTAVSVGDLQTLFKGMSEASTVLHTFPADVAGVYTQLSQGISLGKLHMQDIHAIAQHLPGTMVILTRVAKDMGTTLEDALAHGGLDAATALKFLGEELHKTFGSQAVAASHSLNAELNRLHSTFFSLETGSKGLEESFAKAIRSINDALSDPEVIHDLQKVITAFGEFVAKTAELATKAVPAIKELMNNLDAIAVFFATRFVAVKAIAMFGAIATSADVATGSVVAFRVAMGLVGGPIGLLATGIAGLAVVAYKYQTRVSEAQKASDALVQSVDALKGSTGEAIAPALHLAEKNKKLAETALNAASAQLVLAEANQKAFDSAHQLSGPIGTPGHDLVQATGAQVSGRLAEARAGVAKLRKAIEDARNEIDNVQLGVNPEPAGDNPIDKIADPAKLGKAKKSVDTLTGAYAAFYSELQKINSADDPAAKIEQDYAARIASLGKLGGELIKAGGPIVQIQNDVAEGAAKLNKQMMVDLGKPARELKKYTDSLNDQLAAQRSANEVRIKSLTLGDHEAANMNALASDTADATKEITDFVAAHQLMNGALSSADAASLDALKDYLDKRHKLIMDNQAAEDSIRSDMGAGWQKGIADFIEETNDKFSQGQQLAQKFTSGFSDAFVQFATGAESAKKAFGDFIDSMFAQALKFVANQAIAKMLEALKPSPTDDPSASSGSGWGGLISAFAGMLGSGKAIGGPVYAGGMYPVTEHGPEVLNTRRGSYLMMGNDSGNVVPLHQTPAQSGTGNPINVYVQPTSTNRTASQVAVAVAREQRIASSRNG